MIAGAAECTRLANSSEAAAIVDIWDEFLYGVGGRDKAFGDEGGAEGSI